MENGGLRTRSLCLNFGFNTLLTYSKCRRHIPIAAILATAKPTHVHMVRVDGNCGLCRSVESRGCIVNDLYVYQTISQSTAIPNITRISYTFRLIPFTPARPFASWKEYILRRGSLNIFENSSRMLSSSLLSTCSAFNNEWLVSTSRVDATRRAISPQSA